MSDTDDYALAVRLWGSPEIVAVHSDHGTRIAVFPLEFIRKGGDNTWSYVLYVVRQLIVLEPGQSCQLQNEDGIELDLNEAPEAGSFRFHVEGSQSDVTFSPGPEYFSCFKASDSVDSVSIRKNSQNLSSTRSISKRTSFQQSEFRYSILARDGVCIVSGEYYRSCEAAHIVPFSRPDLYVRLSRPWDTSFRYDASAGLLLRHDLRQEFDNLTLSFYEKVRILPQNDEHD
nr:hypothetical protein L203_03960 [Cryptococcus depauperatus CBS 7841]